MMEEQVVITSVRNPRYAQPGRFDCEVLHAEYGWIPFTACVDDVVDHGREIYDQILAGDWGDVDDAVVRTDEQKRHDIAARRYAEETGGIMFSGMPIDTGRDSQGLITGATLASLMDPSYVCNWKTPAGWVQLDATTLAAVSQAVRAHVQACFDREAELVGAVTAGTYTTAMLDEGWPG